MNELTIAGIVLPPAPQEVIDWDVEGRVREMFSEGQLVPVEVKTNHLLGAGMYARTVHLPAMGFFTNVTIKVPTLMVVSGYCYMLAGKEWAKLTGYNVFPASAGRKQICITKEPTDVTMIFPTDARTVEEAEAEFTDEAGDLLSREQPESNHVLIAGGDECLDF
jgi:hypothetical protein